MGSRTKNAKRNIGSGIINRFISVLLPFVMRTALIQVLGAEYTGLSSLFNSILHVLNLAELGFSSAVVFSMYKPIAEHDDDAICALMAYYRRTYRVVGTVVLLGGALVMPWLSYLIQGTWPADMNIYLLYSIYLLNTALSYFLFAYKSALLNAFQRLDLYSNIRSAIVVVQYLSQIIILLVTKNYYAYVILSPIFTIISNLLIAYVADKNFPQYKCRGKIGKESREEIRKQIAGLMIGKIGDTFRNSLDSIVLSSTLGLVMVTIYSNYYYIYNALYGFMLSITQGMQASVGNAIASKSTKENYDDMQKFTLLFAWISTFCSAAMLCVYQTFMTLWVGEELLLSVPNMALFCLYFYFINMNNSRNLYFSGNGLWWAGKLTFIGEAVGNLVLNIILGALWGVTGILLATIITIFCFNFVWRTNILFKQYFKESPKNFYFHHLLYFIAAVAISGMCYFVCSKVALVGLAGVVVRGMICLVITVVVFPIVFFKSPYLKSSLEIVKRVFRR